MYRVAWFDVAVRSVNRTPRIAGFSLLLHGVYRFSTISEGEERQCLSVYYVQSDRHGLASSKISTSIARSADKGPVLWTSSETATSSRPERFLISTVCKYFVHSMWSSLKLQLTGRANIFSSLYNVQMVHTSTR